MPITLRPYTVSATLHLALSEVYPLHNIYANVGRGCGILFFSTNLNSGFGHVGRGHRYFINTLVVSVPFRVRTFLVSRPSKNISALTTSFGLAA